MMMSEKRFVQCEIEYGFANTTNIKKIDGVFDMQEEKTYRIEQIVDVLNEQQNTIHQQTEQHKARLDLLIDEIGKLQMEIVELNDENRELQKKIRVLSAHLLSDECALTDSQIRKIKGELDNV